MRLEQKLGSQYFVVTLPASLSTEVTTVVKKVDPLLADLNERTDRAELCGGGDGAGPGPAGSAAVPIRLLPQRTDETWGRGERPPPSGRAIGRCAPPVLYEADRRGWLTRAAATRQMSAVAAEEAEEAAELAKGAGGAAGWSIAAGRAGREARRRA